MTPPDPNLLTIADGTVRVSALLHAPSNARACYVLAHGAGAGMTHPFMAAVAAGLWRARHRDAALPVPLHGARQRSDPIRRRSPRRRCAPPSRGRARAAAAAAVRRRQIVRRPHDVAGAGGLAAAGRARPRLPRLPAAPGRAGRRASARSISPRSRPDAVPAGHARRARRPRRARAGDRARSAPARRCGCSPTPITRSTCRRAPGATMHRCSTRCSMRSQPGSTPSLRVERPDRSRRRRSSQVPVAALVEMPQRRIERAQPQAASAPRKSRAHSAAQSAEAAEREPQSSRRRTARNSRWRRQGNLQEDAPSFGTLSRRGMPSLPSIASDVDPPPSRLIADVAPICIMSCAPCGSVTPWLVDVASTAAIQRTALPALSPTSVRAVRPKKPVGSFCGATL